MITDLQTAADAAGARRRLPLPFIGDVGLGDERLLAAEADHRIANHLGLLAGYVRLKSFEAARQSDEPCRESVRLLLDGISAEIDAVARVHRALAVGGDEPVDLCERLHGVCAPFRAGLLGGAVELVEDFPPGCIVQPEQILPISQIVVEAITNAVKHAHAQGEDGAILVRCRLDEVGAVVVEIIDDGPGPAATFDLQTARGLGFRLMRGLVKQLGASIGVDAAGHGLRFRLTLPPGLGPRPCPAGPRAGVLTARGDSVSVNSTLRNGDGR